jgi:uncharacterized membrane protein
VIVSVVVDSPQSADPELSPDGDSMRRAQWLDRRRLPALVVVVATVGYACLASYFALRRHDAFRSAFDLANFDQALWLLAQGEEPFITQHGRHFLGDHFDLGFLLVVPMYVLGAGPHALIVLQSVTIALVAPLLFALARARGAGAWIAVLPALLWLASPLTLAQNMDDIHHIPVAAPLIVGSVVALQRDRLVLFAMLAILACSFKEDIPLMFAMLGVVVVLEGRRLLGAAIVAGATAVFAFAFFVWVPHFSNSLDWFAKRFAGDRGDSVSDVAIWAVRNPIALLEHLATLHNVGLVAVLVLSTGGLCLLAPRWLLLGLPALLHNLLSDLPEQRSLLIHYQFPVMLGLAIAAAVGASKMRMLRLSANRRVLAAWIGIALGLFPIGLVYAHTGSGWSKEGNASLGGPAARREAVALIPGDAPIASSVLLTPHLAHRRELYTLPLPFIFVDYGGDLTREEFRERARGVQYVLLDDIDRPKELRAMPSILPPVLERQGFREVATRGSVHVYAREGRALNTTAER